MQSPLDHRDHRRGVPRTESSRTTLPGEAASIARARAFVRTRLEPHCPPAAVDDLVLVVSELVCNVVLHVGGPLEVVLLIERDANATRTRLEVVDRDPSPPAPREALDGKPGGRGLGIVAQVADDWGWEPALTGKRVWLELKAPARWPGQQADATGR